MGVLRLFLVVSLVLISLGLGLGAFFTHAWIRYAVKPNTTDPDYNANVGTNYLYHNRARGLFWNQLVRDATTTPVINSNDGSPFFTIVYNLRRQCTSASKEFKFQTLLMKSSVALHLGYICSLIIGGWLVTMATAHSGGGCKGTMAFAVALLLLGEIAGIVGVALFHLYTASEETTDVTEMNGLIKKSWSKFLKDATTQSYSYSYGAQIASLIINLLALIVSMAFLCKWPAQNKKEADAKKQDPRWLGSEQGTVIYGGSTDHKSDERRAEHDGTPHGNRRHSWSGYWEDPTSDKNQNSRFRTTPQGYTQQAGTSEPNRRYVNPIANTRPNYYTNNPLYPMKY